MLDHAAARYNKYNSLLWRQSYEIDSSMMIHLILEITPAFQCVYLSINKSYVLSISSLTDQEGG